MKYIAIDYGTKRTGLAASDTGGNMAFPRKTVIMKTRDKFFAELLAFIEAEEPVAIVVGLPKSLDGEETLMSRQVGNFLARLRRRCDLPIYTIEEALSSFEAELELRDAGLKGHEIDQVIDQQAAVRILESFLHLAEEHRQLYD
ncbi:Holliday junction resolvase RuvX [Halodesulfovibrio spirochaetisodalis]|uniref:Putative pre-16S rRNA nuclease n=1 Tax=Halodesulfovibrio spirochaetisodalis TaxID=1560234 RepID=A0A1B7XCL3_9BACT|nr:Holliday junction resolvase RuvX [Halodesulfovibrio spirochaetisodalis]OBQ51696.1 Holliday junction resolvase [Halodesulfovibrio spirochaetisodalis]